MLTKLYPIVQFKKDTWEIDEFDCASIFLLVGETRALLIDTGFGIGDLRAVVEQITDKPITLVISHSHGDHYGGAYQFDEAWTYKDSPLITGEVPLFMKNRTLEEMNASRKDDIRLMASRQKGHIGCYYSMFNLYGYDIDEIYEHTADEPQPVYHPISDGHQFDLGGGRIVTAYFCPGHTADELVFLDDYTRSLICCDAINYNITLAQYPLAESIKYLERIQDMKDRYDDIYNGHHDFRPFGMPLGKDCLPNLIDLCYQYQSGEYSEAIVPSFWDGQRNERTMLRKERNFFGFRGPSDEPPRKK